jgi:hypothetical protein
MNLYSRIYRSIFITFNRTWRSDGPQWNAAIVFPIMTVLNLILLLSLFRITAYLHKVIDLRIVIVVLYFALIVLNYFLFIKNKKFKQFEEEFNQLSESDQRKTYLRGIALSILGYVTPIVLMILMGLYY